MNSEDPKAAAKTIEDIQDWHAHVYFDTATAPVAERVRNEVAEKFDIQMGRWHERLVGPHPRWSYQIAFTPEVFSVLVPWLALNRGGLTVFIHPETGDEQIDHTNHTIWMGEMLNLNLEMFGK